MARPRKYPPELLDRGARLVLESARPIAHVAKDLGVPPRALRGRAGLQDLGVSACAYYQRATGERCQRAVEDQRLVEVIRATDAANYYAYGYRRGA